MLRSARRGVAESAAESAAVRHMLDGGLVDDRCLGDAELQPSSGPLHSRSFLTWEAIMSDTVDTLVLDLLEWIGEYPRPYAEVLEAWRTSCPHLPVWETAEERGFIDRQPVRDRGACIAVSAAGAEHLRQRRRRRDGARLA
jgi:hypothetical protein